MKHKLSKKAARYIAQHGLQIPYESPYTNNETPFDLSRFDSNLQTSMDNQLLQPPSQPIRYQSQQPKQNVLKEVGNAIPFVSSAIKIGAGISSLIKAKKERKLAKIREQSSKNDLEQRMNENRENDFYQTPYTVGNYSDFNKKGGLFKYQMGGLNGFQNFYDSQEQQNKIGQLNWEDYYQDFVNEKKLSAQQLKQQGLSDTIGGAINLVGDVAKLFQFGGYSPAQQESTSTRFNTIGFFPKISRTNEMLENERASYIYNFKKEYPQVFDIIQGKDPEKTSFPKRKRFYKDERMKQEGGQMQMEQLNNLEEVNEDLYSPDFQSPNQDNTSYYQELMNKYQALDPEDHFKDRAANWIFQEEPEPDYSLSNYYFDQPENQASYNSVIDEIRQKESGGNPEAINPTTGASGLYQFVPRYWSSQIGDFMSIQGSQDEIMEQFRKNPKVQDQFMQHVVENIYKPEIERLRPLAKKYGFNDDNLIKMLHYRGIADTRKRLETGNFEVSAEEKRKYKNPDILTYIK